MAVPKYWNMPCCWQRIPCGLDMVIHRDLFVVAAVATCRCMVKDAINSAGGLWWINGGGVRALNNVKLNCEYSSSLIQ